MCGIAGVVEHRPDQGQLKRMAQAMACRGPDGQATWEAPGCGLAFRRLAIIDLDERSMQPMHLGPWHLVFNGEIYNYRELREQLRGLGHEFHTEGDGEVLLHAWSQWGEAALDRLNGMFGLAIWHDEREELVLASDPFGEKPVHWTSAGGRLVFASSIHAILAAEPTLGAMRSSAAAPFMSLGLMPPIDESWFDGIHRLPGGHLLRWRDGRVADLRRYWAPREINTPREPAAAAAALRELLVDSVRLRMRADVPVGTSLSGGVDSSAIVALAGELAEDHSRHAFTATFPGFARDEWAYAAEVATRAGVLEHHAVVPTGAELREDLEAVVADQEEPFGSASIYAQWRVMRAAREAGITVLLDGQGADELFGGYPGLAGWATRALGPRATAAALLRGDGAVLRAVGSDRFPAAARRWHRRRLSSPYAPRELVAAAERVEPPAPLEGHPVRDPLHGELLRQAFHTSLPGLLRYADRDSMAHSREVRLPFLDRRIADFAFSLPPELLYRDGVTKRVLRDAVRGLVPDAVLDRRDKVGFEPPQARWLAEPPLRDLVREVLLDDRTRTRGLVDVEQVEADSRAGAWRDHAGIWRALSLELWLRGFDRAARPAALSSSGGAARA